MNQKAYVASQAWFTTLFTLLFSHLLVDNLHFDFIASFLPGLSVALSHFVIILIALMGIPSLAEIRLNQSLKTARKTYIATRDANGASSEVKSACQKAIDDIDLAIIAKSKVKIEACQQDHAESVRS